MTAERHSIPAFSVMTERFASAADLMGRVLGYPGYAYARIGHPVSSATDAQLEQMARTALKQGVPLLVK